MCLLYPPMHVTRTSEWRTNTIATVFAIVVRILLGNRFFICSSTGGLRRNFTHTFTYRQTHIKTHTHTRKINNNYYCLQGTFKYRFAWHRCPLRTLPYVYDDYFFPGRLRDESRKNISKRMVNIVQRKLLSDRVIWTVFMAGILNVECTYYFIFDLTFSKNFSRYAFQYV